MSHNEDNYNSLNSTQKVSIIPADLLHDRLDKIEDKLDKLSDAMIQLAKTEQKLLYMESETTYLNERLNKQSEKIDDLQLKSQQYEKLQYNVNKVIWLIITAAVTVAVTLATGMKF